MSHLLVLLVLCLFTTACFAKVNTTNRLAPGMTADQVRNVMGEPSQTQFVNDKIIWKYSLHQPWVGFKPYYLAFDKETGTLQAWAANEAEFRMNQQTTFQAWQMLNQTFPPKQRSEVEIKIKRK